jgi:ABC-type multidrug transport system ATPase subunit
MPALLQFNKVEIDKAGTLSFSMEAGETRVLIAHSQEAKAALMDVALGELLPASGEVLLHGQPLDESSPGSIGWVPAGGGLISNLKAWENITLPLWYHQGRQLHATEEVVARWLAELGLGQQEWGKFMASPVARLKLWERKLAGLLRGLVLSPAVLVVDGGLFDGVDETTAQTWIDVLEKFARATDGRAVLAVVNSATLLSWKKIE